MTVGYSLVCAATLKELVERLNARCGEGWEMVGEPRHHCTPGDGAWAAVIARRG